MSGFKYKGIGIGDEEFIRGQIPMTKKNIRILSVAKLFLEEDSIVYDIGAGTGSVSVEMAYVASSGKIYSIEEKSEGVELIEKNASKFDRNNIEVIHGHAPECMSNLEVPTHAFIGGSNGKLLEIVELLREKNKDIRIVINAVTTETLSEILDLKKQYEEFKDMEMIQVGISNLQALGSHHLFKAENPIYIACMGGKFDE